MNNERGIEHLVQVLLTIRDEGDADFRQIENELHYRIPNVKTIKVPIISVVPKTDPLTGEQLLNEYGERITEEIQNGYEEVIDESYINPYEITAMDLQDQNIVKLSYLWLKANIELFADFADA